MEPQDHGNATDVTILLPGDEPQGAEGTVTNVPSVSPAGDEENMRAAFEAAGVKPPAPAAPTQQTTLDPALIEALRKLDPATLPEDVVKHLDRHLLPDYTRKTQALAEERRAFEQQRTEWLNRREEALSRVGTPNEKPTDRDVLGQMRERLKNGDLDALDSYVDQAVKQRVAPVESTVALRTAYESAEASEPLLKQHAEEVGTMIRQNPDLVGLITAENYRFAPMVFTALARDVELRQAQQKLATFEERVTAAVTKGIEAYQARLRGLPQTTTLAGTTATVTEAPARPKTWEEARAKNMADLKAAGIV